MGGVASVTHRKTITMETNKERRAEQLNELIESAEYDVKICTDNLAKAKIKLEAIVKYQQSKNRTNENS